jgi:hypothetical protein
VSLKQQDNLRRWENLFASEHAQSGLLQDSMQRIKKDCFETGECPLEEYVPDRRMAAAAGMLALAWPLISAKELSPGSSPIASNRWRSPAGRKAGRCGLLRCG